MEKLWDDIDIERARKIEEAQFAVKEECKAVTVETAVELLTRIDEVCDQEMAHVYADEVLCTLLRNMGHNDIVDAYDNIGKWYS